jgi:hypothetical protein
LIGAPDDWANEYMGCRITMMLKTKVGCRKVLFSHREEREA